MSNRTKIVDNVLIKKEKESGKLRMAGGSWTINLDDLQAVVDSILYITESHRYLISFEDAMLKGFEKEFRGERKLIVPLKYWRKEPRFSV